MNTSPPDTNITIGKSLVMRIEDIFENFRAQSPLFSMAQAGEFSSAHLALYITNIHYLIRHTPVFLKLAIDRAESRKLPELADFYRLKMQEEEGHDKWAENDLAGISQTFGHPAAATLLPGMADLVRYIFRIIEEDPYLYLAYILLAEHFTVLCAPPWIEELERNCGISKDLVSVVGNHAELDQEHVEEMITTIDGFFPGADRYHELKNIINEAMTHYCAFCQQLKRAVV